MADEIKINIIEVARTGVDIQKENTVLSTSMAEAQTIINNLVYTWKAPSADSVIPRFYTLTAKHFPNTYDTVKRYVDFLANNIAQGYVQTEDANTLLADAFKE